LEDRQAKQGDVMRTRLGCIVAFMVLSVGLALAAEKQIIRRPGTKTGGNYSPGILASFTIGVLCAPVALADQTAAPPVAIRDVAGSTFALAGGRNLVPLQVKGIAVPKPRRLALDTSLRCSTMVRCVRGA